VINKHLRQGKVLITGGTSGLGLELVKSFLDKGFEVVATGRNPMCLHGYETNFSFYRIDFSHLGETALIIEEICRKHEFDYIVNNAGILSPPVFTSTKDGIEYTFQVNFLAHLMLNEIILRRQAKGMTLRIAAVTSPVYRLAGKELMFNISKQNYKPFRAYKDSKFYLSLMCRMLSMKYHERGVDSFSFDPGTFSSGIYRMQNKIFRMLYRIAAPFMRQPRKVAVALVNIISENNAGGGIVCNIRGNKRELPGINIAASDKFWEACYEKIGPYLT